MARKQDERERFWSTVDTSNADGCWLWTAWTDDKGYGYFSLGGSSRRHVRAHRVAWEWANQRPIPDGYQIDHICHTPGCVRPEHLRLATNKQNLENRGLFRNNTSGVRGVSWSKARNGWHARVCHNGKFIQCGLFNNLAEAEAAVIAKRNELFTHNDADRSSDLISAPAGLVA